MTTKEKFEFHAANLGKLIRKSAIVGDGRADGDCKTGSPVR